jgi:nicotinamide-nucleotide amidase
MTDQSREQRIERAVILSCGDELTTGRIADTNAAFIADALGEVGISVVAVLVVGDDPERITWAWTQALAEGDVVIATGGLGPTVDDLTTETLARVLGRPLIDDPAVAEHIRRIFAATGREMPSNNLKQAQFPSGALVIPNPRGTAPGYRLTVEKAGRTRHLVVMPGVPREMTAMWRESVLPWLRKARGAEEVYLSRTFQTFGLSESGLDELLQGVLDPDEGRLSFRASFPEISVRVSLTAAPAEAERRLATLAERVRSRIAEVVIGEGSDTMEGVVGVLLRDRGLALAVAESCTGGLIGHRITNVPGSSAYFREGVVCYSNAAKQELLGVAPSTLAAVGAVSEEVAREMAVAVRRLAASDLGLATTGIAGPDGGTPEKPVGTVCIALASAEGVTSRRYQLWGTRDWVKILTSQIALDWVRRHALGLPVSASGLSGSWERTPTDHAKR